MDGSRFIWQLHGHGTVGAAQVAHYKLPCDATLVQVDAVTTDGTVGTLKIGIPGTAEAYLTAFTFGASNVPTVVNRGDFNGSLVTDTAECPHIAKDTVLEITVSNASMVNPDVLLTFLEG